MFLCLSNKENRPLLRDASLHSSFLSLNFYMILCRQHKLLGCGFPCVEVLLKCPYFGPCCFFLKAEVEAVGEVAAQLSEAAQSELLQLCEDQFAQLEKVNVFLLDDST